MSAAGLGGNIKVQLPDKTQQGVFDTITETGALQLIQTDGEVCTIAAGDVFFMPS